MFIGRRKKRWLIAAIAVAIVAIGVGAYLALREPPVVKQMRSTWPLSFENADSAVAVMQAVDTASLRSEKLRALHTLYLQQALYKQNLGHEDLTALDRYDTFFATRPDDREKMLYLYLHGESLSARKRFSESLRNLLRALKIAEEKNDMAHAGRICDHIVMVYLQQLNGRNALKYSLKAQEIFKKTGEQDMYRWQMWNTAQCYQYLKDYDKSLVMLDSARALAEEAKDEYLGEYINRLASKNYRCLGQHRKSIDHLQNLRSEDQEFDYYTLAYDYFNLGMIDSAMYYQQKFSKINKENVKIVSMLAQYSHDYKKAAEALEEVYSKQDDYYQLVLQENIAGIESEFHVNEVKEKNSQLKTNAITYTLSIALLSLAVILILMLYLKKKQTMRREADEFVTKTNLLIDKYNATIKDEEAEIASIKSRLQELQTLLDESKETDRCKISELEETIKENQKALISKNNELELTYSIRNEISKRFSMLDEICLSMHMNYSSNPDQEYNDKNANKRIVASISKYLIKYKIDNETIEKIEHSLDCMHQNIMSEFKASFPSLYEKYGLLFMYHIMGLESYTFEYLLSLKSATLRSQTHRLRRYILESNHPEKEKFLAFLKKRKA